MFPASNHGPGQNIGFPDPCLTPAVPPIVVPYPNFGSNAMAIPTAPNVLVSAMPAQNMGSMPALTNGDNAGCIHPIGMMKPGGTTMGNPMVIINGLPSKHLLCPSQGNLYNNPLGATLIPDVVNVLYCDLFHGLCGESYSDHRIPGTDVISYVDHNHLTGEAAEYLAPFLCACLRSNNGTAAGVGEVGSGGP